MDNTASNSQINTPASAMAAPSVTEVEVDPGDGEWLPHGPEDDAALFVHVYPSFNGVPLDELRLYRGEEIEQWCDDTGYRWSPQARAQLAAQVPPPDRPPLPGILTSEPLDVLRDEAVAALVLANDPPVFFRRGAYVTEIARNEKHVPFARQVSHVRMRERLADVAYWNPQTTHTAQGVEVKSTAKPPADLAAVLNETPQLQLPPLLSIVEHPVMAPDGTIRTRRGYDPETGTYFAPSLPMRRIKLTLGAPTRAEDLHLALTRLNELVQDFEFVDHADKTNVLALMLTPILRPVIEGPVPLAAVRAVRAGTGKSLLVKAALSVLTGREPSATGLGKDEDEAEKRLLALFLEGRQVVFLDNIKTGAVLETAALARALTTETWEGRIIRSSKSPSLPVRCTWVATGNNLTMSDELARRAYLIELTSALERPDLRPMTGFLHPDLLGWVKQNREELLTSLLILAHAWAADGMKITDGPSLSSFESWSKIVGSILRFAGLSDFLGNEHRKRDIVEDDTNLERANLLLRMQEQMGSDWFTIKAFHAKSWNDEDVTAACIPFLDGVPWDRPEAVKKLGYSVRSFRGAAFGGLTLAKGQPGRDGVAYRVESQAVTM